MPKEYEFVCYGCESVFTTTVKDRAYCRECIASGAATELNIKPLPTVRQAAKWESARAAKRLMKERAFKIRTHDEMVRAVKDAKAGDVIIHDEMPVTSDERAAEKAGEP